MLNCGTQLSLDESVTLVEDVAIDLVIEQDDLEMAQVAYGVRARRLRYQFDGSYDRGAPNEVR